MNNKENTTLAPNGNAIVFGPKEFDMYEKSKKLVKRPFLNDAERIDLVKVEEKFENFENIIKTSAMEAQSLFCKGMILRGPSGTGKTHNIVKWLTELTDLGADIGIPGFVPFSGKISAVTLYNLMESSSEEDKVLLLDDADVWWNQDSLSLLKAALNTGQDAPRRVSYGSHGQVRSFEANNFMMFITNQDFTPRPGWEPNEHLKAVLDRVHVMEIDLTKEDMFLKNVSIIEESLNGNDKISEKLMEDIFEFYNEEIREFFLYDSFSECKVDFSIRFIMKIVDLKILFGDRWKDFSMDYKRLKSHVEMRKISPKAIA